MERISIEIRFTDVDSQDHVNHTAIIEWIAHARVTLFDEKINQYDNEFQNDYVREEGPELDHVLVNLNVNFQKEVFYPGTIEVTGQVLDVGNKSVTTEFFVYNKDELVAGAQCINVFFNPSTKKSIEIPEKLKNILMNNKTSGTFISGLTLSEVEHIKLEKEKSPLLWEGLGGK